MVFQALNRLKSVNWHIRSLSGAGQYVCMSEFDTKGCPKAKWPMKISIVALVLVTSCPALAQGTASYQQQLARRIGRMVSGCHLPKGTITNNRLADIPVPILQYFPGMIGPTQMFSDGDFPYAKLRMRLVGAVSLGHRWAVVYDTKRGALTTHLFALTLAKDETLTPVSGPDIEFFRNRCVAFLQALTPARQDRHPNNGPNFPPSSATAGTADPGRAMGSVNLPNGHYQACSALSPCAVPSPALKHFGGIGSDPW